MRSAGIASYEFPLFGIMFRRRAFCHAAPLAGKSFFTCGPSETVSASLPRASSRSCIRSLNPIRRLSDVEAVAAFRTVIYACSRTE